MPKSGSTFLSNAIAEATGFKKVDLVPAYGRREQELCEIRLTEMANVNYVAQHHVRRSSWTDQLCREYSINPIVLVRNFFDVVMSIRDHVRNEKTVSPVLFLERHHAEMDDKDLERMIAKLAIPWYLNFYVGWRTAPNAKLIDYEVMATSPVEVIHDVLRFAQVRIQPSAVAAAVERIRNQGNSRLNIGVAGRGRKLQTETVGWIMDMVSMYPEIAGDPFIRRMKEQISETALSPQVGAASTASHSKFSASSRFLRRVKAKLGIRHRAKYVGAFILLAMSFLYFAWPNDIIIDSAPYGMVDDAFIVSALSFIAGYVIAKRLIRRIPVLLRAVVAGDMESNSQYDS